MARQEIKETGKNNAVAIRKQLVKSCKRVVIKAGTRLLVDAAALARLVGTNQNCPGFRNSGNPGLIQSRRNRTDQSRIEKTAETSF